MISTVGEFFLRKSVSIKSVIMWKAKKKIKKCKNKEYVFTFKKVLGPCLVQQDQSRRNAD